MPLRFFEGFRVLLPGADEVLSVRQNSSVLTRVRIRAHANYIMYVISHPFSQDNKNYAL